MQEEEIEEKEQESSKLAKIIGWINASKGFITATAALLASVGALAKPQDHSVTKTAYDTLSSGIKEISDEQRRDHDDVVALRGYLEGLTREKVILSPTVTTVTDVAKPPESSHRRAGGARRPAVAVMASPVVAQKPEPVQQAPELQTPEPPALVVQAPELPPIHQEMKRTNLPVFDALMK